MRKPILVAILLLPGCIASSARAQVALSASDSASIALLIAKRVGPDLRSVNGADSTNAVCVNVEARNGHGTFLRVLDSALRATTGGAVVAPMSISPLRGIVIDTLTGASDGALVKWRTTGGGLAKGEMAWGHHEEWRLTRRDSTWTIVSPNRVLMGDGYIRNDLPKPPDAPGCDSSRSPITDTLLVRTQQWVDAWNEKDVGAMRRLHAADVGDQRYVIGNDFTTMEWLLKELRETNFWNVTWSIRMADAKVRMLGAEAGLVSFRLTGSETPSGGAMRPFSEAFTLIFQRIRGEWLIVHVHDSMRLDPGR
ncbi:MAG TPA: nuclear transport factor 2 family protein [Gemmatimonadaceae bacterium]|nr:nuclear transport factor 2 family protein [Gemmatimonadaceae bacterium]